MLLAPEAVLVALIGLGLSGTLASVTVALKELAGAKTDFDKAANIYDVIKGYGTQI